MKQTRPTRLSLKDRIESILIEEVNRAEAAHINLFVIKASNRLLELVLDELNYGHFRTNDSSEQV